MFVLVLLFSMIIIVMSPYTWLIETHYVIQAKLGNIDDVNQLTFPTFWNLHYFFVPTFRVILSYVINGCKNWTVLNILNGQATFLNANRKIFWHLTAWERGHPKTIFENILRIMRLCCQNVRRFFCWESFILRRKQFSWSIQASQNR